MRTMVPVVSKDKVMCFIRICEDQLNDFIKENLPAGTILTPHRTSGLKGKRRRTKRLGPSGSRSLMP